MDDVVHKVTAVGSRDLARVHDFIDKFARSDEAVKAYGTYEQVYADKVRVQGNL